MTLTLRAGPRLLFGIRGQNRVADRDAELELHAREAGCGFLGDDLRGRIEDR